MNVNKPISRRKALKVMGLGMLAACVPTLPSFGESPKENEKKTKRLIFYFSATGNSLYIARQLGGDEATLLSISQEIHNEHPDYEAEEIGFVCPVYCFIPPAIACRISTWKGNWPTPSFSVFPKELPQFLLLSTIAKTIFRRLQSRTG